MTICKAAAGDLDAVAAIYEHVHDEEESGRAVIGWIRGVYPTRATAEAALAAGDLFVMRDEGRVVAAARINRDQVDVYAGVSWRFSAAPSEVMVLHTLVVDPAAGRRGYGTAFVDYYERFAREQGCTVLRMDTNARNARARAMYRGLGYREAGIAPCVFNGIPGVELVCLEKSLKEETAMSPVLIDGYDRTEEIGALFAEYTDLLIEGDPKFREYLDIQHYDAELADLRSKYGRPDGRLYLALVDGEAAGCIGLRKIDAERCEMKRLYVRPSFQHCGIGETLARRVIDDAREIGYAAMLLDTLPFLQSALRMYQRLGFREIGCYNDSPMDTSIYMQLDL